MPAPNARSGDPRGDGHTCTTDPQQPCGACGAEYEQIKDALRDWPDPAPGDRLRHAAYRLRKGAPIPVECDHLRAVLAAVLDQEATWADDRGDRYPTTAAVLALADVINQ